jgi:hypothetical protein
LPVVAVYPSALEEFMQPGKMEMWDITSPFFRQALRDGDESSEQALNEAIEDALAELSMNLLSPHGFRYDDNDGPTGLIDTIQEMFMDQIAAEDEIAKDQEAMQEGIGRRKRRGRR